MRCVCVWSKSEVIEREREREKRGPSFFRGRIANVLSLFCVAALFSCEFPTVTATFLLFLLLSLFLDDSEKVDLVRTNAVELCVYVRVSCTVGHKKSEEAAGP